MRFISALSAALIVVLGIMLFVSPAPAQTWRDVQAAPDGSVTLPHGLTPEEMLILDEIGIAHRSTPPPSAQPVRAPAEFDRMQGVLIRYPLGITTSIVREMAENTIVYCIVTASQQNSAYNLFNGAGVNMDNVIFFNANSDTYWTRDYGPWFIYDADLNCGISDHIYNRPRPNDDQIPWLFGAYLGIEVYGMDLVTAGGNWMTDGHGISASSDLVYEENPNMTPAEIAQMVSDYLGVHTYHVVPDPNGTYIDHIDCWGKFLAVDKVLIREVPPSHSQYDEIEETVEYFANQVSSYGWPYQIYRVYTPSNEPYTNSLILNEKVLVPITGSAWDDDALATYQAAMPGYEVLGFTGSWQSTDALHCRAKGVADLEVLYVYSTPLRNTDVQSEPYRVAAEIIDHSETGLIADQLRVYWRADELGPFGYEVMTQIAGTDSFYADIPPQTFGTTVEYYVHAADNSGRVEDYPLVGAAGAFSFTIEADETPPVISGTTDLLSTENTAGPYVVETTVTDNSQVAEVVLSYRINGGVFVELPMTPVGGDLYSAGIPGQPHNTHVEYYVTAADPSANQAYDPPTAPTDLYDFFVAQMISILFADIEGGSDWTHGPVTGGYNDAWHVSDQRNHTPAGVESWKCGDTGGGDYGTYLDAGLVTESFDLAIDSRLTFWHWIDAEVSGTYPGYAYDGGLVEINTGGGWETITPDGGYPYLIRNTGGTGPFAPDTGVFSGSHDWVEVSFDLRAFSGSAQVRFRFGSDASAGGEGWYVDDIAVDGFVVSPQGLPQPRSVAWLDFAEAANPVRGSATVRFVLEAPSDVSLRVFDPAGRLVADLIDRPLAPGAYSIDWNRRNVAPGVYFYKLAAAGETRTTRVVLLK